LPDLSERRREKQLLGRESSSNAVADLEGGRRSPTSFPDGVRLLKISLDTTKTG